MGGIDVCRVSARDAYVNVRPSPVLVVDIHFSCNYDGYNGRDYMKQLSSRFSIAVHILSLIAHSPSECTGDYIARSVNTNPVIIRKIIGMLKKAGLIQVRRGVGGASLLKPPDRISLLDVYNAVDVAAEGELFNFHDHPNPDCTVGRNIEAALRSELMEAQEALEHRLAQTTIGQLNDKFSK